VKTGAVTPNAFPIEVLEIAVIIAAPINDLRDTGFFAQFLRRYLLSLLIGKK
jgi:hypothetical protein